MAIKQYPTFFDELMVISITILWLVINYNLPLSNIYIHMIWSILFLYIVPIIPGWNFFSWIEFSNSKDRIKELLVGVGTGIGFILFYNYLGSTTPMSQVFAETAFGASVSIGQLVFGLLIPIIESVFFFIILPHWIMWKMNEKFNDDYLTFNKVITTIICIALFTWFHATSKGLTNTSDLAATAIFGLLSMGLLFFFKSALPIIIPHIIINSKSVGVFDTIMDGGLLSSPFFLLAAAFGIIYLINSKKVKIPFIS